MACPALPIPEEIIEQIRASVSLHDLVSEQVALKRSGRSYVGLCPFHQEKTPSFNVNDEEGFFRCFGCDKKGSIFDFVMETRGLTFPEAARFLAGRAGIDLPEVRGGNEATKKSAYLRELLKLARSVFVSCLADQSLGEAARGYLQKRGLTDETIKLFELGCVMPSAEVFVGQMEAEMKAKGITAQKPLPGMLEYLGIIRKSDYSSGATGFAYYLAFKDRLIFPITRSDGVAIAFGGRLLREDSKRPKYINSVESLVYSKRRSFYGLSQALKEVRSSRHVYIVEGYMDVLSMYQAGVKNVVATCGTALTEDHAQILRRLVDTATIVFDGDSAGKKAAARCFPVFLGTGIKAEIVTLEIGQDPDSLARECGKEALWSVLSKSRVSAVDIFLDQAFEELGVPGEEQKSAALSGKVANRFAEALVKVDNPVERELLVQEAVQKIGVGFGSLNDLVEERIEKNRGRFKRVRQQFKPFQQKGKQVTVGKYDAEVRRSFHVQLLVCVICEPSLAGEILRMPSIAGTEQGPDALLPEQKAFLELIERDVDLGISYTESDDLWENYLGRIRQMLVQLSIEEEEVMSEANAQRRLMIDASSRMPSRGRLVQDLRASLNRQSTRLEVNRIRQKEADETNDERLVQLAQEKLERRRKLEHLLTIEQPSSPK